jgi:hypothetical protein
VKWTGFIWLRIEDDIKVDLREMGYGDMDLIDLLVAQDSSRGLL